MKVCPIFRMAPECQLYLTATLSTFLQEKYISDVSSKNKSFTVHPFVYYFNENTLR